MSGPSTLRLLLEWLGLISVRRTGMPRWKPTGMALPEPWLPPCDPEEVPGVAEAEMRMLPSLVDAGPPIEPREFGRRLLALSVTLDRQDDRLRQALAARAIVPGLDPELTELLVRARSSPQIERAAALLGFEEPEALVLSVLSCRLSARDIGAMIPTGTLNPRKLHLALGLGFGPSETRDAAASHRRSKLPGIGSCLFGVLPLDWGDERLLAAYSMPPDHLLTPNQLADLPWMAGADPLSFLLLDARDAEGMPEAAARFGMSSDLLVLAAAALILSDQRPQIARIPCPATGGTIGDCSVRWELLALFGIRPTPDNREGGAEDDPQ